MKISTKLFVGILFSLFLILILGFVLFLTNRQINQASEKRSEAEKIVTVVFERNLLFNEFINKGGERVTTQLQIKNTFIGEVLFEASQQFVSEAEKNFLTSIKKNYSDTTAALERLIESYGRTSPNPLELALRERLINQILIESQSTVNGVVELAKLGRETVIVAQQQAQIAIIVFILFLLLMMGGGLVLVNRSITQPMKYLLSAVQFITEGDLERRVRVTSKDEIGILARAFNTMTKSLRAKNQEIRKSRDKMKEKVEQLEKFQRLTVGRELKMIELKKEVKGLKKKSKMEEN